MTPEQYAAMPYRDPNEPRRHSAVKSFWLSVGVLLLWGIFLLIGTAAYLLHHNGALLAYHVEEIVSREVPGLSCTIRRIEPALRPAPGLRLIGLLLRNKGGDALYADACDLGFNWKALFRGNLVPGSVTLHSPLLHLNHPGSDTARKAPADFITELLRFPSVSAISSAVPALPDSFSGMQITVRNGELNLLGGALAAFGLELRMTLPPAGEAPAAFLESAALHMENLEFRGEAAVAALRRVRLNITDLRLSENGFSHGRAGFSAEKCRFGPMREARLDLHLTFKKIDGLPALDGRLETEGLAELNAWPTPFAVTASFSSTEFRQGLKLKPVILALENDVAILDGHLFFQPSLQLNGTAEIQQLNLPRWFGFARELPDGIQQMLDNLKGRLTFVLTPQGLEVPALEAALGGADFQGSGGVQDFRNPVIHIQARTSEFDVAKLFPELAGKNGKALVAPPAVPLLPDSESQENDIGYEIRLAADKAVFRNYSGGGLEVALRPLPKGTRVTASLSRFYEGSLQAALNIEESFAFTFRGAHISAAEFFRAATGSAVLDGTLSTEGSIKVKGSTAEQLFSGFSGTLRVGIDNGSWHREKSSPVPFSHLGLSFSGKGTRDAAHSGQIGYTGLWQTVFRLPDLHVRAALDGAVQFSARTFLPVQISDAPLRTSGTFHGIGGELMGKLDFDAARQRLQLKGFKGNWGAFTASGDITGTELFASPVWEGDLRAETTDLRSFLQNCGLFMNSVPSDALRKAGARSRFTLSDKELRLNNFSGKVDATVFSGMLARSAGAPPFWRADLKLGRLDIDRYFQNSDKKLSTTPWPTDILRSFNLEGRVCIDALTIAGIEQQNAVLPLRVSKGVLEAAPMTSLLYGGQTSGSLRCETMGKGFLTHLAYVVQNTNMLQLTMARGQNALVAGQGNFKADIRGLLCSSADIPAALNGTWGIRINKGYLGARDDDDRRFFNLLSAFGRLQNGIVYSDDLRIHGNDFNVQGKGHVNLVNRTLNYNLRVTAMGLRDIPVTYSGSLSDPRRNVSALGIVTGSLGILGRGIFGLIENMVRSPLHLLKQ